MDGWSLFAKSLILGGKLAMVAEENRGCEASQMCWFKRYTFLHILLVKQVMVARCKSKETFSFLMEFNHLCTIY